MVAVGIFAEEDKLEGFSQYSGLVHGGGFYLLGVQVSISVELFLSLNACLSL
jgi:hypothetical protein